ncbi:MAG: carbon-nitrogen hydrolase family protein [Ktedonobacteraceae bacterium]
MTYLRTAVIQLNSRSHVTENMSVVEQSLDRAAMLGAQFVALPEYWTYLGPYTGFEAAAQTLSGPAITLLQAKARQHKMIVHGGSIVEKHSTLTDKFYNTSVLINREGEIVAQYHKIHLFDVDLANGEKHYESERIIPGDQVVTAEVDGVRFGLTVCYDLRFPELFRSLALQNAHILLVPAGFTLHTGRDHWEVLLRARAIENACYVVAPAQIGRYQADRQCFGRSMVIDPWGLVLAQAQDMPTVIVTEIDLSQIERVRAQIPSLQHRRPDIYSSSTQ